MRHFLVAVSGLYIFLAGCKEYPCNPATSNMAFVAFRSDETDSILVKKYSKASNFTTLIDSFLLTLGTVHSNNEMIRYLCVIPLVQTMAF